MKKSHISSSAKKVGFAAFLVILAGCASNTPAPVVERGGQHATAATDMYTVKSGDTIYSIARDHGMDFRELVTLNGIENPNQISVGKVLRIKPATVASQTTDTAVTAPVTSDVVVVRPIGEGAGTGQTIENRPGVSSDMLKREPRAGKEPYSDQALAMAQGQASEPVKPAETPVAAVKPEPKSAETPAAGEGGVAWIWPASGKMVGTFSESGSKGIDIAGKAGDPVIAAGGGKVVYSGTGLRGYGKLVIIKHNNTYLSAYAHNQTILVKEGQSVTKGQKIAEMGSSDTDQTKLHFEVRQQGKPVDPLKHLPPR